VIYPDSADSLGVWTFDVNGNHGDHFSTEYDQLGRTTSTTDQRGVEHDYIFDSAGRLSADTVDLIGEHTGQNVDDSILAIVTAYDDVGRVQTVTSYDSATARLTADIVNQDEYIYDGWGNVKYEWQAHDGPVDDENTNPSVEYIYGDGATGGVAKYNRLVFVFYPNGDHFHQYAYGNAGSVDDIMSRVERIGAGGDLYATYKYLGASKIVVEDYAEAEVKLDYTANNFAALDRFGRVLDQIWTDYGANPDVAIDHYTYSYDRAGNRTSKVNVLKTDHSLDETYDYDALDRLTAWDLGGVRQKTWSYDALGNDLSAGTFNAANEETPDQGSSGYDDAGNMITLKSGKTAVYDAWNRLVKVTTSSGQNLSTVEKYEYDGENRRIQIFSDFSGATPGTVEDDYYIGQQVVESDMTVGGTRDGGYQFLLSPRYIDAPIFRDTLNTAGDGIVAAERVFYLSDANYNVTGLMKKVSGVWQVVERYTYNPYGVVTYRAANWTMTGSSANNNTTLYTGRTLDLLTALYYYRARYYDALMERFINRDPIGYDAGDKNLYRYSGNSPLTRLDPLGTSWLSEWWNNFWWPTEHAIDSAVTEGCGAAVGCAPGLATTYMIQSLKNHVAELQANGAPDREVARAQKVLDDAIRDLQNNVKDCLDNVCPDNKKKCPSSTPPPPPPKPPFVPSRVPPPAPPPEAFLPK
jgi:RHS repeat-associated protein